MNQRQETRDQRQELAISRVASIMTHDSCFMTLATEGGIR